MSSEKKKYLVKFKCIIGEYEHIDMKIFDKKNLNGDIVKIFGV